MNTQQLTQLRLQLLAQRASLHSQLIQLRGGDVGRAEASAAHFGHREDSQAQVTTEKELEFALDDHESRELREVEAALARLDAGTYGYCVACGEEISAARLAASPEVARCINCQSAMEQAAQHI